MRTWRRATLLTLGLTPRSTPHTTYIATHKFPPRAMRGELARALTTLWGQMADRGLEHHYTLQQQQQQQQVAMKTGEE